MERFEEKKAALKKLHLDSERFWAQTDAKAYSVADLEVTTRLAPVITSSSSSSSSLK